MPVLSSGAWESGGATMGCLSCDICARAPPLHAQPAPPLQLCRSGTAAEVEAVRVERRAGHCPCPPLQGGSAGVSPPLPEAGPAERAEGGEGGQGQIRRVWGPVPAEQGPHGAAGQWLQAPSPHDHPQGGSTGSARRGGGGAGEKAEILRLEAENKLLREQLKAAEAARKMAQEALTGERAAWERREKGWEKQRAELQQQLSATAQVRAVGGGGVAEGGANPDHVLYLQAAAVELHSALSAQRHVALNMGVKETTLRTELKGLLDKHPVAHLLDPKRTRAEEGEGSQGSKRARK